MQATVRHYDPATGAGDVLLDDGSVVAFDGAAMAASGLRLLRVGQRVRLRRDGGAVVEITIPTLPDA